MRLENRTIRVPLPRGESWLTVLGGAIARALDEGAYPLRTSITHVRDRTARAEATVLVLSEAEARARALSAPAVLAPQRRSHHRAPFVVIHVVPTGVRCEFGGYAGDACPVTNLLAAAADVLVTHPNAVNGSELNEMAPGTLYVEGKALDDFLLGHVGLLPVTANRIGTFVDPAGLDYLDDLRSALDAGRAVAGIDCGVHVVLRRTPGAEVGWSESGCAVGGVANPEVILEGVEALLADGAEAIGGVSVIHGVTAEAFAQHMRGEIPNPSGGVEAIITHLVSTLFRVPTAHAPLPYYQHLKQRATRDPRAAAEFISTPHYLCVLKGLARAPRLVPLRDFAAQPTGLLTLENVGAIVVPASCLGGIPALAAEFHGIPLIAVRENRTILDVTNAQMNMSNVVEVESYLEAAGVVLSLRHGLALESLRRPLAGARRLELPGGLGAEAVRQGGPVARST
jgi:hypothetical protein